jgi:CheY-like chemotaxis protein
MAGISTRGQVLIADDDPDIRASLHFFLEEDEGYQVAEASNGGETLDHLRASAGPEVILLDLVMPEPAGIAVLRAVSEEPAILARTRFVLLSARHEDLPAAEEALVARLGVVRVRKPFELEEVLAAVHAAFASLAS